MTISQEAGPAREFGRARKRVEDARLVTGRTNWTDNIQPSGVLHLAFVRSPMAHARIDRVDVSPALLRPGVIAAYSGAELAADLGELPCGASTGPDMVHPPHRPLATDEVRHQGDAVAVVVARDRYAAADAVEAVEVDYTPLPAVLDMEAALAEGAPLVHESAGTNRCYTLPSAAPAEYAAARERADVVVTRRYRQQRLLPSAMEPRAVVAEPPTGSEQYTVWSSTQVPHILRVMLAATTGIPEHRLRVVAPDVGGGFGSKLQVYAEEVVALVLAKRLGRPVKWTANRSEDLLTTHQGRDQIQDVEVAATRDGKLLGLKVDLLADMGAYLGLNTPVIPLLGASMFPGIYKMDAYSFSCTGVFTTKTPTDAYRGAGRPEATFAIERIMTDLAAELGLDPLELRRRNWIKHEEFPYASPGGVTYDSGNYEAATEKALALFGYDQLRDEQRKRVEGGDPVRIGIGVSTFTEMCGLGPSRAMGESGASAGGWEAATVRVLPTGKAEVVTGTSPHGQGHVTSWSQLVADALGVPFEDVEVVHSDTRAAPLGLDTYGSRSLAVGGVAIHNAAGRVVDKARTVAAHLLEVSEQDLQFAQGVFSVAGDPSAQKSIQEIAFEAFTGHNLPDGMEPSLDASCVYDPIDFSYPHGTHLCALEVDTETGRTRIRSYVCVDDVGTVVNPLIVEGQVHGGLAQGIAQALYEEAAFDEDGNMITGTLADYLLPSAADLPEFTTDRTETPATTNPLGVKGVGEAGTIASTPAIVNAVVDALRPFGVQDVEMPCTPERVWRSANAQSQSQSQHQHQEQGGSGR
jgi:carbon-monoxide dehydrogenase large subunit